MCFTSHTTFPILLDTMRKTQRSDLPGSHLVYMAELGLKAGGWKEIALPSYSLAPYLYSLWSVFGICNKTWASNHETNVKVMEF